MILQHIHILGQWQFSICEVCLTGFPLGFLPLVMDDLIGLCPLHIQYSLSKTVLCKI